MQCPYVCLCVNYSQTLQCPYVCLCVNYSQTLRVFSSSSYYQYIAMYGRNQSGCEKAKQNWIFNLYTLGFLDHLYFLLSWKLPCVLSTQRLVILCHMIAVTKAQLLDLKLVQKLFQFERKEIFFLNCQPKKNNNRLLACWVIAKIGWSVFFFLHIMTCLFAAYVLFFFMILMTKSLYVHRVNGVKLWVKFGVNLGPIILYWPS